ncbi:hypothetical protein QBC38DRAFT_513824 [Podospora fimiseda]|uniref:Uncharacterized protein n=1 Tax=Podospora fimiseda TaxID=252190 RepID=A0AAN6YM56_9PEZI|nr:hypothetical protein QBC38DRAFT_513824 [Podospora fimiseda]
MGAKSTSTEWISTVATVASAVIAMVTLFTVYLAAMQLANQNRLYKLALSHRALGPWRQKVAQSSFLGLRRRIYAPVDGDSHIQAKASWVNFLQALDLSPAVETNGYEMQDASDLVNGVVPMHWAASDLVGLCSILGFQSAENDIDFRAPMSLPMQWSCPLGWLQFRSSPDGCIAEFRRRAEALDQLPLGFHQYWKHHKLPRNHHFLASRLWHTIGGLRLANGDIIFLGGRDSDSEKPCSGTKNEESNETRTKTDPKIGPVDQALFDALTSKDLSTEEIQSRLFGPRQSQPPQQQQQKEDQHSESCPMCRKHLLRQINGLLSTIIQSDFAHDWGLRTDKCKEFGRKCVPAGEEILELLKEAFLLLRPDGYYFTPARFHLVSDLKDTYSHITEQSNVATEIFPSALDQNTFLGSTTTTIAGTSADRHRTNLYQAMLLCNRMQSTRKTGEAFYSVQDMRVLAKVSHALWSILSDGGDLVWAMLYSPDLCRDIRQSLTRDNISHFAAATMRCKDGKLQFTPLIAALSGSNTTKQKVHVAEEYQIPLVANGDYNGMQVLAAIATVFITHYWIERRWETDVVSYEYAMPQSIKMC